jgi:hypothetical protein
VKIGRLREKENNVFNYKTGTVYKENDKISSKKELKDPLEVCGF